MPAPDVPAPLSLPREASGFRLKRELGRGGMGVVYEAEEIVSGRRVALKVLLADLAVSEQAYERFQREARLAAAISHVHCVFVYGAHQIEGSPAIAMEIVDGETLEHKIARKETIPIETAVRWTIDLIDGLEAAHRAGVLHRDVKPSNCFVTTEGRVKVGDFGLSRTLELDAQLTQSGQFLGSPLYASPEQARGRPLDVRSDMYSCGATLYAVLTGRAPYSGSNVGEVLARILSEPPDSPRSVRPEIPSGLENVILRAMHRDPNERYANLAELREELAPFASSTRANASPWKRIVAYWLDSILMWPVGPLLMLLGSWLQIDALKISSDPSDVRALPTELAVWVCSLAYFTILEGRLGTTLGKWLFGLRVVEEKSREPSTPRAFVRALAFSAPGMLLRIAGFWFGATTNQVAFFAGLGPLVLIALLFTTARRRNGWRGLHEIASGTVVVPVPLPFRVARPTTPPPEFDLGELRTPAGSVGAYSVEGLVGSTPRGRVIKARDQALARSVWIHMPDAAGRLANESRRSLSRPARLRWLGTVSTPDGEADVFESPGGTSLPVFAARHPKLDWLRAQQLIVALVRELRDDGINSRRYALEQVWIDRNWSLRLLDDPLGAGPFRELSALELVNEASRALFRGLGPHASHLPRDLPLHAEATVARLLGEDGGFKSLAEMAAALESVESGPPTVAQRTRVAQLAINTLIPAGLFAFALLAVILVIPMIKSLTAADQYLRELHQDEQARAEKGDISLVLTDEERDAREILIIHATKLGGTKRLSWKHSAEDAELLERVRLRHGELTPETIARAEQFLAEEGRRTGRANDFPFDDVAEFAAGFALVTTSAWGIVGLGSAFALRGGLMLTAFGIRVRNRRGRRAGRWWCLLRCFVAWLPVFGASLGAFLLVDAGHEIAGVVLAGTAAVLWLAALVHAMMNPAQSIVDRLLGTRLVPR